MCLRVRNKLADAIGSGRCERHHNTQAWPENRTEEFLLLKDKIYQFASGFFEEKPRGNHNPNQTSNERTLNGANQS